MKRCVFLFVFLEVSMLLAFPRFKGKIPNGENIPHPCKVNHVWRGVGHLNPLGGGALNEFGRDFKGANKQWTKDLCQKDSDGDGRTNGEELGDPECTWTEGSVPKLSLEITHPGVCEPFNDPICKTKNAWVSCELDEFVCDALNDSSTRNITIRIPEMDVPKYETNYYCMLFEFPADGDYHMVAMKPYIDNEEVLHHMLIFGCDEREYEMTRVELNTPYRCGMIPHQQCSAIIGGWTVGSSGFCVHKKAGFRIGTFGFRKAAIQVHWNNPQLKTGYKDSSGMTLYYTPNIRENDAVMMVIGQEYIEIPPGKPEVRVEGGCTSEFTNRVMTGPLYISGAVNHMHYLGRKQYIEQYRNGIKVRDITKEEKYNYDSPIFNEFHDPYEVLPGDELKTTCFYNSTGKALTTFQGAGTRDEMCYGFLTVFPSKNVIDPICTKWRSIPNCKIQTREDIDGCSVINFKNSSHSDIVQLHAEVFEKCAPYGNCREECKEYVKTLKATHPCLKNDVDRLMRMQVASHEMDIFYQALDSCDVEIEKDRCHCSAEELGTRCANGADLRMAVSRITLFAAFLFSMFK